MGSLWGLKSDSRRFRKLRSIRFILNKRVNFREKINFFIRVFYDVEESSSPRVETYKTVKVDSLMRMRDVLNAALPKFRILPNPGRGYEIHLCKPSSENGK